MVIYYVFNALLSPFYHFQLSDELKRKGLGGAGQLLLVQYVSGTWFLSSSEIIDSKPGNCVSDISWSTCCRAQSKLPLFLCPNHSNFQLPSSFRTSPLLFFKSHLCSLEHYKLTIFAIILRWTFEWENKNVTITRSVRWSLCIAIPAGNTEREGGCRHLWSEELHIYFKWAYYSAVLVFQSDVHCALSARSRLS